MSSAILSDVLDLPRGDRIAVILPNEGRSITYQALRDQVFELAETLRGLGVGPGDRVATSVTGALEAIVSFFAASLAGAVAPLNPGYRQQEVEFYLGDTDARILLCTEGSEAAKAAAGRIPAYALEAYNGVVRIAGVTGRKPISPSQPEHAALVLHTSGSTGRPKRVPLRHSSLLASARTIAETYCLSEDDVALCVMPLFHVHGLVASVLSTFHTGGTIVAPERFNPLSFWRTAQTYNSTWYSAAPAVHQMLLKRARGDSQVHCPRLRFIRSCSAPLPPEMMLGLEKAFGVPVLEAYGMTEAAHQMCSNPQPPGTRKAGSVGPATGLTVGVMDSGGALLDAGLRGEVVICGSRVFAGYENNPEANASSFVNGWFRTGDQGFFDRDGYLTLTGRIKELINRGGEKIAPREIDEVLLTHPDVTEAVAFGIPHSTWGEEVEAMVVLGSPQEEAAILAFCRERLADYKCPKKLYIVESIPRTATGKIQRASVAQMAARI